MPRALENGQTLDGQVMQDKSMNTGYWPVMACPSSLSYGTFLPNTNLSYFPCLLTHLAPYRSMWASS